MTEFSIIVPCYDEAENIPSLLEGFAAFLSGGNSELILVNNGSTDSTINMENEMKSRYPFLKWINIEKNIGYGHGIFTGLKQAQGKYIGYTHADLQTDPTDVKKAVDLITSLSSSGKVLVKGSRKGRSRIDRFFSRSMELIVKMFLKQSLKEINAQPNIFTRDIFENLKTPPLEWGFDLYLYYAAVKTGCDIRRFDVFFPERKSGTSKWNRGFFSKIAFSFRMIKYCIKLKHS